MTKEEIGKRTTPTIPTLSRWEPVCHNGECVVVVPLQTLVRLVLLTCDGEGENGKRTDLSHHGRLFNTP
jgi:hypothetical protein